MKSFTLSNKFSFVLAVLVLGSLLGIAIAMASCNTQGTEQKATEQEAKNGNEVGFGIFLADSGELVLSEQHIKVYHKDTHKIELNEEGIEKWNSYMTYQTIPKLSDGLFGQDFVVKVQGTEAYRGHFWSMVSSSSTPEVVILETLFKLDSEHNTIRIEFGYPWSSDYEDDPRDNPAVFAFLEEQGLLE